MALKKFNPTSPGQRGLVQLRDGTVVRGEIIRAGTLGHEQRAQLVGGGVGLRQRMMRYQ